MKNLYALLVAFLLITTSATAANLTLEYDHDAPITDQVSFVLEKKDSVTGTWTTVQTMLPGVKTVDLLNVLAGTHTFRVYAVSPEGVTSEPSNELTIKVPNSPKNLRVKVKPRV